MSGLGGSSVRALDAYFDAKGASSDLNRMSENEKRERLAVRLEEIKAIREDLDLDEDAKIGKLSKLINWELYEWLRRKMGTTMDRDPIFAGVAQLNFPKKAAALQQQFETASKKEAETREKNTIYRDEQNKILGGVCSGIAERYGIGTNIVRAGFVILTLVFPATAAIYLYLWYSLPKKKPA